MLHEIIKYKTYFKYWLMQYNLEWLMNFKRFEKYSWILLNILIIIFIFIFKPKSNRLTHLERRTSIFTSTKSSTLFTIKLILFLISLYFILALKLNYKYL